MPIAPVPQTSGAQVLSNAASNFFSSGLPGAFRQDAERERARKNQELKVQQIDEAAQSDPVFTEALQNAARTSPDWRVNSAAFDNVVKRAQTVTDATKATQSFLSVMPDLTEEVKAAYLESAKRDPVATLRDIRQQLNARVRGSGGGGSAGGGSAQEQEAVAQLAQQASLLSDPESLFSSLRGVVPESLIASAREKASSIRSSQKEQQGTVDAENARLDIVLDSFTKAGGTTEEEFITYLSDPENAKAVQGFDREELLTAFRTRDQAVQTDTARKKLNQQTAKQVLDVMESSQIPIERGDLSLSSNEAPMVVIDPTSPAINRLSTNQQPLPTVGFALIPDGEGGQKLAPTEVGADGNVGAYDVGNVSDPAPLKVRMVGKNGDVSWAPIGGDGRMLVARTELEDAIGRSKGTIQDVADWLFSTKESERAEPFEIVVDSMKKLLRKVRSTKGFKSNNDLQTLDLILSTQIEGATEPSSSRSATFFDAVIPTDVKVNRPRSVEKFVTREYKGAANSEILDDAAQMQAQYKELLAKYLAVERGIN